MKWGFPAFAVAACLIGTGAQAQDRATAAEAEAIVKKAVACERVDSTTVCGGIYKS